MPPIVVKKGIVGTIWEVPIAQSQVLPFRHTDFMQNHTQNLDGIARIRVFSKVKKMKGFASKEYYILELAEKIRFREMDDFMFKHFAMLHKNGDPEKEKGLYCEFCAQFHTGQCQKE